MPRSRSIIRVDTSSRRRPKAPRHLAVLLGALALWPAFAAAQQTKIAVLPINGPAKEAAKVTADLIKILRKSYDVVAQADWDASATKLVATTRSADDIGAVAKDLGVQVVITGAIKKDPGWTLVLTTRHGPSGKPVDKLRYPLRGAKVDPATLKKIPEELPPLIEKAATTVPEGAAPEEPAQPEPNTAPVPEDTEAPLAPKKVEPPPVQPRPIWAPYVDASAGFILGGRNFAFDDPMQPQFRSSVVPGIRVDATAYPLAMLSQRPGAAMNVIQGLGVGATFDYVFWPDSVPCPAKDAEGNCIMTMEHYATTEYRLEAGLRWHWNILNKEKSPELLFNAQYGLHSFSVAKTMAGADVGPPDVEYQYVTIGLGTRVPLIPQLALLAGFNFHVVLEAGDINTNKQYGPGGTFGLRAQLGAESRVWRGLTLRLLGYYEYFGLSFDNDPMAMPAPTKMAKGGAADQYYGVVLSVGYVF